MNNKAINEFGFRRIWRIKQISESVIQLGLTPSSICLILHILRKPNLNIMCFEETSRTFTIINKLIISSIHSTYSSYSHLSHKCFS